MKKPILVVFKNNLDDIAIFMQVNLCVDAIEIQSKIWMNVNIIGYTMLWFVATLVFVQQPTNK